MSLRSSVAGEAKIYNITESARTALPNWLEKANKKALKKDEAFNKRIELLQDFGFPAACLRLKATRDGQNIIATGVYKPQMRVYELSELSMKFDRHTDCENVQFEILSDDWKKTVHLQADRTVEFHSQFGLHFTTRIPKFGRDMVYHHESCDLLLVGASNDAWRLNLELGKFLNPLQTDLPAINTCSISNAHQLHALGGENGVVEFWDPRTRNRLSSLPITSNVLQTDEQPEITALRFAMDGLTFAVGTSSGHVLLYDLRNPIPRVVKDHQYGYPIKSIHFHEGSAKIVSADTKSVKIWDRKNGKIFASMEPPGDINDVLVLDGTGMVMVGNESPDVQTYFLPQLGPAPRWCSFLENLTEEMEESAQTTVYDDYKFVTAKELASLGLDHLIGTDVLRAYMHGYFIDLRLYEKARQIANPFAFEEYRKKKIQDKIEQERASRISAIKKLPKVNRNLAQKLLEEKPGKKNDVNPMADDRFADLFADPDFQVDEESHEYLLRHPDLQDKSKPKPTPVQVFEAVESDGAESDFNEMASDTSEESIEDPKEKPKKQPKMFELKRGVTLEGGKVNEEKLRKQMESFEDRVKQAKPLDISRTGKGNLSMTFQPKSSKSKGDSDTRDGRERRGVKGLGFKKRK